MSSGGLNASQALILISTFVLARSSDGRATLWALDEHAADHAHRLLERLLPWGCTGRMGVETMQPGFYAC